MDQVLKDQSSRIRAQESELKNQSSRIRAQESELRAVPSFQTLQIQRVQGDPYKFEP